MITLAQYWMGRDTKYAVELTAGIRLNAEDLLDRVNRLLAMAAEEGIAPAENEYGSPVASGWRPSAVNDKTANAAAASKHMTGEGIDLRDNRPRAFARWCLRHLNELEDLGLWMEDPRWTPTWVHLQMVPPRSGNRVYVPSNMPALAQALVEQGGTA
jgi:hypothetical protein